MINQEIVYLNDVGKRIVLSEFERKMNAKLVIKGNNFSYRKLIRRDLLQVKKCDKFLF